MRILRALPGFLSALGLTLTAQQIDKLEEICGRMRADPLYTSVSKIIDPAEIATKHFLDSLAPLGLGLEIWNGVQKMADIGTGGGFPAIPLSVMFPEAEVWAIDAKGKSVDFVHRIREDLELGNLIPRLARAEELGRDPEVRESFDLVVCRALASVRVLVEYCLPLVRVGGNVLLYKGPNLDIELGEARMAFLALDVRPEDIRVFTLKPPRLPFGRGYVTIAKSRPTLAAYPRRNGVPASKPL